jgi:hyperosmotically inducible protein
MLQRIALASMLALGAALAVPAAHAAGGSETVGSYIDDSSITTSIKAKFVQDKSVDANAISVETVKGTVLLSGFAKDERERAQAELIARSVKGVQAVNNRVILRTN